MYDFVLSIIVVLHLCIDELCDNSGSLHSVTIIFVYVCVHVFPVSNQAGRPI